MNNDLVKLLCFQDLEAVCIISPGWVSQCCTYSLRWAKSGLERLYRLTNVFIRLN